MPTFIERARSRVVISEGTEGLRILIRPTWDWGHPFILVWLYFWTTVGISRGSSHLHHLGDFLGSWMLGWAFGELIGIYFLLHLFGWREIIVVRADSISYRSEVFGLGFITIYPASEIRNLRFQPAPGGRRSPSQLAFDYRGKTVAFAAYIENDAEKVKLLRRIQQRCATANRQEAQESGTAFWAK